MSGIEIVGLVMAIVSAFTGTLQIWQNRSNKADKAAALEKSLTSNPRRVQDEYDQNFNRLGQKFARGDAIAHSILSTIAKNLQQELLLKLFEVVLGGKNRGDGMYASMLQTSDNSRIQTISALGDQYQRLAVAAPVPASLQAHNAYCDVCRNDIYGTRYKCTNCRDYDMCSTCFNYNRARHSSSHRFREV